MNLELKHLEVYRPFNVKFTSGGFTGNLERIHIDKRQIQVSCSDWWESPDKYKMILKPLEDLFFNDGDVSNESEKPFEVLEKLVDTDVERQFLYHLESDGFEKEHILKAPYTIIQKLIEWHFDVFGLIDAGLAVDMNCL